MIDDGGYHVSMNPQLAVPLTGGLIGRLSPKYEQPASRNPMTDVTREEIHAKIEASEARGDTKIATAMGKIDLINSKLDAVSSALSAVSASFSQERAEARTDNRNTRSIMITVGLGLAALIVGLAFGLPSFYSVGTQTREIVRDEVKAAMPPAPQVPIPSAPH